VRLRPRYPGLFLVALLISVALWYAAAGQRRERISEKRQLVPLTLINVPAHLVITSDVPERIAVGLRGPLSALRAAETARTLEAILDLSDAQPGLRTYSIQDRDIHVPPGVQVVSIEPAEITLQLERLETRTLPVRPVVTGEPAPGYAVAGVEVAPDRIAVSGPGSLLGALTQVTTEPVSVDGATEPVEAAVRPDLPHPLLRAVLSGPLLVVVDVEPAPTPTPTPGSRRRRR